MEMPIVNLTDVIETRIRATVDIKVKGLNE